MIAGRLLRRHPTLHFALAGALLFGAHRLALRATGAPPARPVVTIGRPEVDALAREFTRQSGRAPDGDELGALVAQAVDDELLYREALALGLDRGDRSVQWRLIEKMRFLAGENGGDDPERLYDQARAMGLDRDDPVLRRLMIRKMKLLPRLEASAASADPAALREYYASHRAEFAQPERVSFTHVFFGAARGGSAAAEAERLRAALAAGSIDTAAAVARADAFPTGATLRAASPRQLRKLFGDDFAARVLALAPGRWSEPLRSPYGLHLVMVHDRAGGRTPPLRAVASQVRARMAADLRAARVAAMMTSLRAKYEVRVATASSL